MKRKGGLVTLTSDGRTVKITWEQWLLAQHLKELGIMTEYEHHFWERRDWRLDLYAPELRMGFEVHGGQFSGGHRRGVWGKSEAVRRRKLGVKETPQEDEYNKLNIAQMDGIRVLQFTNEQVNDGRAKAFVAEHRRTPLTKSDKHDQLIEELGRKLQDLRCDFEKFREWARKGPYGFNFRDEKSGERQQEHRCHAK